MNESPAQDLLEEQGFYKEAEELGKHYLLPPEAEGVLFIELPRWFLSEMQVETFQRNFQESVKRRCPKVSIHFLPEGSKIHQVKGS